LLKEKKNVWNDLKMVVLIKIGNVEVVEIVIEIGIEDVTMTVTVIEIVTEIETEIEEVKHFSNFKRDLSFLVKNLVQY
jgi:hypothetical protein